VEDYLLQRVITATIQKEQPVGRSWTRWGGCCGEGHSIGRCELSVELAFERERWRGTCL